MASPLFNIFNPQQPASQPTPQANSSNMFQRFLQFRNSFNGDPKAEVEKLLQSGKMTQEQLQQYTSMAQQMMQFFR